MDKQTTLSPENKLATAGYPYRPEWISKPMTRQQSKAAHARYRQDDTRKTNTLPRGVCAQRMIDIGWEFKDGQEQKA
ncbi:hypothetical protein [Serratia fonticola]|uniref:hypothetical protein n=1 Tax=Serratia fonticola TaxID=47917 RepID=UPI0021AE0961|nr:hypothetical protein [Serratia fonticola]